MKHRHEIVWSDELGEWFCRAPGFCDHPYDFDLDPPAGDPDNIPDAGATELLVDAALAIMALAAPAFPLRWTYLAWCGVPGRDYADPPQLRCRERGRRARSCRESEQRRLRARTRSHPPVAPPCPRAVPEASVIIP
jgi:hypothetical protein